MTDKQKTLSTKDNPLTIFVDGSHQDKQSREAKLGYGAYMEYEGAEYSLSGNSEDVKKLLRNFDKFDISNPTAELLGLLVTLRTFECTSEHVLIRQDYKGAINFGELWCHSENSSQHDTKPWKPKECYIRHIVTNIEDCIAKIEENGGSVEICWVPGHIGSKTKEKYSEFFGALDSEEEVQLGKGNDAADAATKNSNSFNTIKDLLNKKRDAT